MQRAGRATRGFFLLCGIGAVPGATVTTFGYTGLLAGPALIGAVAHVLGLPLALGGIAALLVTVSAGASIVRRSW